MGKFEGVLLATDFDDTLYDSSLSVSAENIKAITYFIGEGGYFTVSTGRAHRTFAPYASLAPINCPVILSNGSGLYDFSSDRVIFETFLPARVKQDLIEVVAAIPEIGFEAYQGDDIYVHNPNQVTWNHLRRARADCIEIPISEIPGPWSKVILEQERSVLERVRQYMTTRWDAHYEIIFSNNVLLELTEKGSNKGGMVLRLADYLGVRREHIYCVGDNENDLPMLAVSAIPFAPANCAPIVKNCGARMLGSCDESCIAELIGILDEIYRP